MLFEDSRALSCSPGVDTAAVLRHAASAYGRRKRRNVAISVTLFILIAAPLYVENHRMKLVLVGVVTLLVAALYEARVVYKALGRLSRPDVDAPRGEDQELDSRFRDALSDASEWHTGNVTIFPASSPFFGYGISVRNWSIVCNGSSAVRELDASSTDASHDFSIYELRSKIAEDLKGLKLRDVTIEDRLMISGADVARRVQPTLREKVLVGGLSQISPAVDQDVIKDLWEQPDENVRPYLACSISSWGGNLVLTAFMRIRRCEGLLSLEANYCLLTPIDDRYQVVDAFGIPGSKTFWTRMAVVCDTIFRFPFQAILSPSESYAI